MSEQITRERMVIPDVTAAGRVRPNRYQELTWEETPDDMDRIAEATAKMTMHIMGQINRMGMLAKVRLYRRTK